MFSQVGPHRSVDSLVYLPVDTQHPGDLWKRARAFFRKDGGTTEANSNTEKANWVTQRGHVRTHPFLSEVQKTSECHNMFEDGR